MRMVGEQFRQRRSVKHKARRRLALCGTLRHAAPVAGRVRTGTYSQDARWRLADAVKTAREEAGYKSRPAFYKAAGIGKRSLENVESKEPNAASVGETVLHAIGRALPGWTKDTPRIILEGGPIPAIPTVPAVPTGQLAPLDEVLSADIEGLGKLARLYAWFHAQNEGRDPDPADEERFMLWAIDVRKQRRGISPHKSNERDVS